MMNSNERIARAIRVRLLRLEKTQGEVAEESGVNPSVLSSYMSGRVGWRVDVLDKIAPSLDWGSAIDIASAAESEQTLAA
jgi:transcriptional regulator with XRE-family HTH domain